MPRLLRHLPPSGSTTTRDGPRGACLSNRIRFGTTVDANRKQRPRARNCREPEMEAEHTLVPRTMFSTTPFGVTTSMVEASSFADEIFVCRSNVVLVTGQPREGPWAVDHRSAALHARHKAQLWSLGSFPPRASMDTCPQHGENVCPHYMHHDQGVTCGLHPWRG